MFRALGLPQEQTHTVLAVASSFHYIFLAAGNGGSLLKDGWRGGGGSGDTGAGVGFNSSSRVLHPNKEGCGCGCQVSSAVPRLNLHPRISTAEDSKPEVPHATSTLTVNVHAITSKEAGRKGKKKKIDATDPSFLITCTQPSAITSKLLLSETPFALYGPRIWFFQLF